MIRQARLALPRIASLATLFLLAIVSLPLASPVVAQTELLSIRRVSAGSAETNGNSLLYPGSISADGRYVAFESAAGNLVPNDSNGARDVFVHDRRTGETTRVSVDAAGNEANEESRNPSISADGRYVAFDSYASNLVTGDTNDTYDVFVYDRQTEETSRVSLSSDNIEGNNFSYWARISADGRWVAFGSEAGNLVSNDSNGARDVFVHDRQTGETTRVSVSSDNVEGDSLSYCPSISADGRYIAFVSSGDNLVPDDSNAASDVFVHDRQTGETTRVSVDSTGDQGNGYCDVPTISADGRHVAFVSYATNLVPGDSNGTEDIFVYDRQTAEASRVSLSSDNVEGDGYSYYPSISADGQHVAFYSFATNLVPGDSNGVEDVFVHDRQTGETSRVSVDSAGNEGNGTSYYPSISADGQYVAFFSYAGNLVDSDTNSWSDIFLHERGTGETIRVSLAHAEGNGDSLSASVSADGRYVAFASYANNLSTSDNNSWADIFVRDRQTGVTTRVSVASGGGGGGGGGGGDSVSPSISADGRYVAFQSDSSNLVATDNNSMTDVFVHDRQTHETVLVSLSYDSVQGNGNSLAPSISADGRYVAFESVATNLVASDANGSRDVFVRDLQAGGTTVRISVHTNGAEGAGDSNAPSISADGRYVAFYSYANNLVDGDTGHGDVFVHDCQSGVTTRVSVDSAGNEGDSDSIAPSISTDGRYVAFESYAANLVAGDTNGVYDIFVHDCQTLSTVRVSVASDGTEANGDCSAASISGGGQSVAFFSSATNLVAGDANGLGDVFVREHQTGETIRVSESSDGSESDDESNYPRISSDGVYVAFESDATNLVPDDANGYKDVFSVSWRNPELGYDPASMDFGARFQNATATQPLHLRNLGIGTLTYSLSETSPWCSVDPTTGDSSGEQDDISVTIDTAGLPVGDYGCVILIPSDGGMGIVPVHVSVQPTPAIAVVPASHDFGTVAVGGSSDQTVTVSNTGTGDLIIGTVAGADLLAAPFSIVTDNCSGRTILPGDNCTMTVRYSPTTKGNFTDSFDIPSNDPITPGAIVTFSGVTPNVPPTAPVVDVTPDLPTAADNLVCNVVVQSTDADAGDSITYAYQWSRNGEVQSALTSNTVPAANTTRGEVWRCVVTPSDGTAAGTTAWDEVTIQDGAPTAPVVDVTPNSPATDADLACNVSTPSTDPDGDAVTYSYQWYKDGALQSDLIANAVAASHTAKGQVWRCVVTPIGGTINGTAAWDEVTIQNSAPTAPVISITPESPSGSVDLVCSITTQSTDADGDAVTYTYRWYKDGALQTSLITNTVPSADTAAGQEWKCVVTPSDGAASGPPGEVEVSVGGGGGMSGGAIAGIVVGVLVVLAGAGAFAWYMMSKRKKKAEPKA